MKKSLFFILIFISQIVFGQDWRCEGPFYGKAPKRPYMHSMGLVDEVLPHPTDTNTFLMSTNSSGIWKTTNRGVTWECKTEKQPLIPGMGVLSFSINPNNSQEIVAAAGNFVFGTDSYKGGVLRSTDWGETWSLSTSFDSIFKGNSIVRVQYFKELLYVLGAKEVFVSSDNGGSWNSIFKLDDKESYVENNSQYICDFEITPDGTLFISTSHRWGSHANVWRGTGKNKDWVNLKQTKDFNELNGVHIFVVKMAVSESGKLVIGLKRDNNKIDFYESKDFGKSFYRKGGFNITWETGDAKASKFEIGYSIDNPDKLYLGLIEFFEWDSISGMKMLSPSRNISAHEHDDVRGMTVYQVNGKERVVMGNDGGISFYYPENKKFESLNGYNLPTLQAYNLAISQFDTNFTMLIGTQDNGTHKYQNGEWNFISGGDGGSNFLTDNAGIQASSMNSVIVVYQGKLKKYYSPNRNYSSWFINAPINLTRQDSTLLFGSGNLGGGAGARLYQQDVNDIIRGVQKGTVIPGMKKIGTIELADNDPNIIWLAEGEAYDKNEIKPRLVKSLDKGKTFVDLTDAVVYPDLDFPSPTGTKDTVKLREFLSYQSITDIELDPHENDVVYISISGFLKVTPWSKSWEYYRLLKSEDGGESFTDYTRGLPAKPVHCLLRDERDENLLISGTDEGIYYRMNENEAWKRDTSNFPENVTVTELKLNYCQSRLYASTYGRSVWSTYWDVNNQRIYGRGQKHLKIKKDQTWDEYQFTKYRTITVKNGKSLTIKAEAALAPNTRIILEPKSKLILDGGSIQSGCKTKWYGEIELEEKRFLWIFKKKKGEVILKNGGKIKN